MTLCPQLRRLAGDHARWLADIAAWTRAAEEDRCSRLLALWEREILPHCRAEEDVLLPELAGHLSEADAVIVFTQGDHLTLRRLARKLRDARGDARRTALAELERKLAAHAAFEERTLFPAIQEALGCGRLAELAADVAAAGESSRPRPTSSNVPASPAAKGRKP